MRPRFQSDLLLAEQDEPWTGPVERRDPEKIRRPSVHLTWTCANPFCRQWAMNGAWRRGRCNWCGTPRPA